MKIKKKHAIFCSIIISIFFAIINFTYAEDMRSPRGETKYAKVKAIEEDLLVTSEGSFGVSKATSVHDEKGKLMSYAEIKTSFLVRIFYNRVNGQLMAEDIIVRKSSMQPLPE
jgi:hypothetical protein